MSAKGLKAYLTIFFLFIAAVGICGIAENEAAGEKMFVSDAVVCQDVVDREPIGTGEVFPSDINQLFCFTRVLGAADNTEIIHNWYFNKQLVSSVNLPVRSTNWRTFSSKKIMMNQVGDWKVEIRTSDGNLLKQIYFLIN